MGIKYLNIEHGKMTRLKDSVEWFILMAICKFNLNKRFECEFHSGIANGFGIFHSSKKVVKGIILLM
jgi:hypothetical protein